MIPNRIRHLLAVAALLLPTSLPAGDETAAEPKPPPEIPEPRSFVTHHTGTFGGRTVRYAATAGETYLRDEDGAFIRQWVTENGRWASPKLLAGESFGTTRAAAVAGTLESGRETMSLNGLVLISQALDYTGSTPEPDNVLALAATARYHGKVADPGADLESFLAEVRDFAVEQYAPVS
jgi:carboxypeptidase C (cathepsin A)